MNRIFTTLVVFLLLVSTAFSATVYPTATGTWSTRTWNNDATGAAYGMAPQVGDTVLTNNLAITIDVSIHVAALSNVAGTTAAAGGAFTVTADSLTSTIDSQIIAGAVTVFTFAGATPKVHVINGSALTINGSAGSSNAITVLNSSTGTLNITGNLLGGTTGTTAVQNNSSGTVNLTGNTTGGGSATSVGIKSNAASGIITVSGNDPVVENLTALFRTNP